MDRQHTLPIVFLSYTNVSEPAEFCHDSYDVIYILSGKINISRPEAYSEYTLGDISLIGPEETYTLDSDNENTILHIGIQSYFLEQHLGTFQTLICDSVLEPKNSYTMIKQLITGIAAKYLEDASANTLAIYGLMFQLLDQLKKENCFAASLDEDIPEKYRQRIRTIIDYIDRHYHEPLTLTSLSEALFLTPQYLSKFFKRYLRKNFKEYLLEKRLFHAYRDICYTDDSITEIAIRHGFSDITAFSKAFRNCYGETPSRYRKTKRTSFLQEEYQSLDMKELSDSPFGSDTLYRQAHSIDTQDVVPFSGPFTKLINIGSVKNLLMEDFRRQLLHAKQSLNLEYIRIQGLISSAFIPRVLPDFEYYFLDTENVLDFLYQHDFVPMIELSRLPFNYSQPSAIYTETSSIPRNRRFFELLESFLIQCSSEYSDSWTGKWMFELWKTPKETVSQYAADFCRIRGLLEKYLPGAVLGGPGFDSCQDEKEFEIILQALKDSHARPDFISAYFSLLAKVDDFQYIVSTDKDIFRKRAKNLHDLLAGCFPDIPFLITEWNSVFLPNIPVQYSCFQAAFICKAALEAAPYSEMLGYWIFSDTTSLQDPTKAETLYFWGQGLFNQDNIAMPSYYAFQLLNYLGRNLIRQGRDYCVTQNEPGHYQILSYHYAHFLATSLLKAEKEISFADTYKLFENTPPVQMCFELENLIPGTYRITRFLLDRANGSILDLWIGGFAVSNIDEIEYLMDIKLPVPEQLDYLQRSCLPEERTIFVKTEDTLVVESPLQAHNVCLWDIKLQK